MDICNSFIGYSKFLGIYPVQYNSKTVEAPFRKARFFLTRHILFIILTIFAMITKYIRFSHFETTLNKEQISLLMKTYGVFNFEFIIHSNKALSILATVIPLVNFTFRDTLNLLNRCAKCTFPCREASYGFMLIKWAILPVMVIANIQDIGFEVYKNLKNWSNEQLLDSFTCLLRTITGLTPFLSTMFLFVCMFSTKEKIKHIRGTLKKMAHILESREDPKILKLLPDVEDTYRPSRMHLKHCLNTLHLKLKALREQHNDLIFSSQSLNKRFQTDMLFMIVVTFYLVLMCSYGLVFNINDFHTNSGRGLINFFIVTIIIIVYRLFLCWVVCHGASSIDVESKLLELAIMKLSISNIKGKRSLLEIQLFHLQCKNRENPFNIFGMFAIGKSFMFMMLTTIISYIAVIIQFTYEAQAVNKTISNNSKIVDLNSNTTSNIAVNMST